MPTARYTGRTPSPEYTAWRHMKSRCLNPRDKRYADYGGKGITVSDRWRNSFEAFLADVGERPGPEYSLERHDNRGHYETWNCYWATRSEQQRNTRRTRKLTFEGKTLTAVEWAKERGIPAKTLYSRLRLGWSVERALAA